MTATMIMVSVRVDASLSGVSLPRRRMLVVSFGTSKVATAVGTAVGGVGTPSKNGGAAVAVSTGSVRGTLVGVCVGATVMVGRGVRVGVGPGVFVPAGVTVGSGVADAAGSVSSASVSSVVTAVSSTVAGSFVDLFKPAASARVGSGSGLLLQLARKRMVKKRKTKEVRVGCLGFCFTISYSSFAYISAISGALYHANRG